MTDVDWHELRRVFHGALDQPPTARAGWLASACGDDEALRVEALALLDAHIAAETFLEAPLARLVGDETLDRPGRAIKPTAPEDAPPAPQRIGPYALERYLGQGGMGTVFAAIRADDTYRDRVAIKVVRRDVAAAEVVARFRRERQLLADLRDPHIAQLLDGGTTDDGRPYLVMEYVDGAPIDVYCDDQNLSVAERLRLFVTVCRTVHRAHQRLVVHRDLKPANLLVTVDGRPKLLDFGIAKLLTPTAQPAEAPLTRDRAPMTIDYASPEQILGQPVTTASDVYGLGVVLFELLAGQRPFQRGAVAPAVLAADVAERAAPVLSGAVGTDDPRRGATSARWRKQLTGDLDTIVAKALHPEPLRRYASAEDLAQDLERHLEGLPVRARPDGVAYRAGKFVRRHRWGVAAATLALVALVGFVATLVAKQRQVVRQNTRAEATSDFLVDLFDLSNPDAFYDDPALRDLFPEAQRGQDVTARRLLDVGARRIDERLADEPHVRASLLLTMGQAYEGLGLFARAGELYEQALGLADAGVDVSRPEVLLRLGAVRREQARFDDARRDLQAVLNASPAQADEAVHGDVHAELARLALDEGRLDDAMVHADTALALVRHGFGANHPRVAAALALRGDMARESGDHETARADLEAAAALYAQQYRAQHPRVSGIQHDLGLLYREAGDVAKAEEAFRSALALDRSIHGTDHPVIARSLHNLADLLREQRQLDSAQTLAEESVAMRRGLFGDDHPITGLGLNLLGLVHAGQGDFDQAEQHHRAALAVWTPVLDPDHTWIASAHNNLGYALRKQGHFEAAEAHYHQALDGYRNAFTGPHFQTARVLTNLGALLRRRGDLDAAEAAYREALVMQRAVLSSDHPDMLGTMHNLAVALLEAGRAADAEPLAREVVDGFVTKLGPEDAVVGGVRVTLGRVLTALGRQGEARTTLDAARATLERTHPVDHPWRIKLAEAFDDLD